MKEKRKLYENQKHSTYEIAKKLDMNPNNLYAYCKGRFDIRNINYNILKEIAEVEEMDADVLYNEMVEYLETKNRK